MPSTLTIISSFLFTVTIVITTVSATEFQVGGLVGWRNPATNESQLYTVWASRRRFVIGDSLRFVYKNNSVAVVEKWGFYHCDSSNPIAFYNDGNTVIDLDNVGTMYFISGYVDRCKEGVKMRVEVMSPGPVRYVPPSVATPPESPYFAIPPSEAESPYFAIPPSEAPSHSLSLGDSPESSLGTSSSGSSVLVLGLVSAVIIGLGLCLVNL